MVYNLGKNNLESATYDVHRSKWPPLTKMIDDGPSSNQGGQMGPNSGYGMNSKQSFDEHTARMDYNMPGILHFLQTEWAKFEMERAQWDVERAELQVNSESPLLTFLVAR